jgi:hypothetical protein
MIIVYSDVQGHFMPIKRPGILTYAFFLDVTPSKILNLYPENLPTTFKSEYYQQLVLEFVSGTVWTYI